MPPLNPLHVFEAAARLSSFTRAADELGVTQSAVSRQVSRLEDYLGTRLFERRNRGIALTPEGRAYLDEIGPAFQRIARATATLRARHETNVVRVACYPTFSAKWLISRLSRFSTLHPNVQVRLRTSIRPVDFNTGAFDVAIQLRPVADVDPKHSSLLIPDIIQPYCSRGFLSRHRLESPRDLLAVPLIASRYRRTDWRDWFTAMGLHDDPSNVGEFPGSLLSYKAAAEGLGAVIGQPFMMADDVASGMLVPLFSPVQREFANFVMWNSYAGARVRNFVRWIEDEIRAPAAGMSDAS